MYTGSITAAQSAPTWASWFQQNTNRQKRNPPPKEQINVMNTITAELKEQEMKKKNIVVFGLQLSEKTDQPGKKADDEDRINNMLDFLEVKKDVKINKIIRYKNKNDSDITPPVIIELSDEKLRNNNNFNGIFINADRTIAERSKFNEMRELRNKMNQEETEKDKYRWTIREDKVVKFKTATRLQQPINIDNDGGDKDNNSNINNINNNNKNIDNDGEIDADADEREIVGDDADEVVDGQVNIELFFDLIGNAAYDQAGGNWARDALLDGDLRDRSSEREVVPIEVICDGPDEMPSSCSSSLIEIATLNCKNLKSNHEYVNELMTKVSILFLQETSLREDDDVASLIEKSNQFEHKSAKRK